MAWRHAAKDLDYDIEAFGRGHTHNGTEGLLRQHRAIEFRTGIAAVVAVAAVMIHVFAEITEQDTPAAHRSLGITLHEIELAGIDILLARFLHEVAACDDVAVGIEKDSLGRESVASGPPYLLIVAFYIAGDIVVHHPAHIALIDSHAKGDCSADHL